MMRRLLVPIALACVSSLAFPAYAEGASIRSLPLPDGFTVHPESETRSIVIASDGTVVALANDDAALKQRAFRWDSTGKRETFEPVSVLGNDQSKTQPSRVAVAGSTMWVTASQTFSGAYSGTSYAAEQWGADVHRWSPARCGDTGSAEDVHANGGDDAGRVAITVDMTGMGSFEVMRDTNGEDAPYAFVADGVRCLALGRAVVNAVDGRYAAGYRGYLDGHLAPTNLNVIMQRAVAVRWFGSTLRELGDGDALAVNALGLAVGASAVPGRFDRMTTNFFSADRTGHTYQSPVPHARAWNVAGRAIALETDAQRSVAYDVSSDGTIVGMLVTSDGKHHAFVRRSGRVRLLDDLPHPLGWRFESAFTITRDGTIAGIGTRYGVPVVFTWRDVPG